MPSDIPLFEDAALSGWVEILNGQRLEQVTSWRYEGGILSCSGEGRGYLVTQQKFKNYVLQVEWKSKEIAASASWRVGKRIPYRRAALPRSTNFIRSCR